MTATRLAIAGAGMQSLLLVMAAATPSLRTRWRLMAPIVVAAATLGVANAWLAEHVVDANPQLMAEPLSARIRLQTERLLAANDRIGRDLRGAIIGDDPQAIADWRRASDTADMALLRLRNAATSQVTAPITEAYEKAHALEFKLLEAYKQKRMPAAGEVARALVEAGDARQEVAELLAHVQPPETFGAAPTMASAPTSAPTLRQHAVAGLAAALALLVASVMWARRG